MATFSVGYNNSNIEIEQQNETTFVAHANGKDYRLHVKQDNEGANHWFESGTEKASDEAKKIGAAIEAHLAKSGN